MPFDISGALDKGRVLHTVINLEGLAGGLPLDYYPNKAQEAQEAVTVLNDTAKSPEAIYAGMEAILFSLVASWEASVGDVTIPLTSEGFAAVGITTPFIASLITAVVNESYAGEASGTRLQKRLRTS